MTRFRLGKDGRIGDLVVVGFHGVVSAETTPAKQGPYLTTSTGWVAHQVGEPIDESGWLSFDIYSKLFPGEAIPGEGTRLRTPRPAFVDSVILVVGPLELAHAERIADRLKAGDRARAFVSSLPGPNVAGLAALGAESNGALVFWCCHEHEADEVLQAICTVAREILLTPTADNRERVERSWWLLRAAQNEEDHFLGIAGLQDGGDDAWKQIASDLLRHVPAEERAAKLAIAVERLGATK